MTDGLLPQQVRTPRVDSVSLDTAPSVRHPRPRLNLAPLMQLGILIPLIAFAVVVQWNAPQFLKLTNILQVLRQAAAPGILACGVTYVVIAGRFDLAVGSILSLVAVLVVSLHGVYGPEVAVLAGLVAGLACGAFSGVLVGYLNLNSVITTLGGLSILQGITLIYTGGTNVRSHGVDPHGWFSFLGRGTLFGIPFPAIELLLVALALEFVLQRSTYGRKVFAVGGGETASRFSGIDTRWIVASAYLISGLATAFGAIVFAARTVGAQNDAGSGYELTVLAAIILGGTSIRGGSGSVLRSVIGVIVLTFIQNGLLIAGLPFYAQWIVTWAVIILAVIADLVARRSQA